MVLDNLHSTGSCAAALYAASYLACYTGALVLFLAFAFPVVPDWLIGLHCVGLALYCACACAPLAGNLMKTSVPLIICAALVIYHKVKQFGKKTSCLRSRMMPFRTN